MRGDAVLRETGLCVTSNAFFVVDVHIGRRAFVDMYEVVREHPAWRLRRRGLRVVDDEEPGLCYLSVLIRFLSVFVSATKSVACPGPRYLLARHN